MRLLAILLLAGSLVAADRPNILWLTSEDNSYHWVGAYGDKQARTPNIDKLADQGIRYTHAYSNAAVCAIARFTLITGRYAPAMGTQNMRSRYPIPKQFDTYVAPLRKAGYYCTNNAKTDYNFATNDNNHWDACNGNAHWKNRPADKPFFAVFNTTISHESSLFDDRIKASKKSGLIPETPRLDPAAITLPPFLPDTPEIRQDWVTYYDIMSAMDAQIGRWYQELVDAGLDEDTIVIYNSDHGGILPREKRYLYDTGTHVPLIIRFPKKWAHLAPGQPGSTVDTAVGFIDLPPTLLSLCGVDIPASMQGIPFLGAAKGEPSPFVYLYAQRFDERMLRCVRGLTDGHTRFLRNFYPHRTRGIFSGYPHGQAGWRSFYREFLAGNTSGPQLSFWTTPQPAEELYNTDNDRWEVTNLVSDPEYQSRLATMRKALVKQMREIRDTGIIPEAMYEEISRTGTVYDYAHDPAFPYDETLGFALNVGDGHASLDDLQKGLSHPHPVMRYWAAIGCILQGKNALPAAPLLEKHLADNTPIVRIAAAEALIVMEQRQKAIAALNDVLRTTKDEVVAQEAFVVAELRNVVDEITQDARDNAFKTGSYMKRIAQDYSKKK